MKRIGIAVIVMRKDGSFLIGERLSKRGEGTCGLAGGKLEEGEDEKDCAYRETIEETALRVRRETLTLVGMVDNVIGDEHWETHFYACRLLNETDEPHLMEPDKASGWIWVTADTMPENIFPPLKSFIDGHENFGAINEMLGEFDESGHEVLINK